MKTMKVIQRKFKLKDDKIDEPKDYLCATLEKIILLDGSQCCSMSSAKYVKAAVQNVEETMVKSKKIFSGRCVAPLWSGYRPETDDSSELREDGLQYYQELIGVLRWIVELGRVDILLETSFMSAHMALPRIGHLEQVIHMFGYLKLHPKSKIAFDAAHPSIYERRFKKYDWYNFYWGTKEAIPLDCPELLVNSISTHCFVDAYLAGNLISRRSQTGFLIFCNRAPIIWHNKRQNAVETSMFGN